MRKIILSIYTITFACSSWAQTLDRSMKPKPGPAPEIRLGKSESFTLANGLRVFVVENHKLPTIECNLELDIKPRLQGDAVGYRGMMSELLLAGTATRSKDQLNSEIDEMGARIAASDEGISGSGLKKYDAKILELMADIAMNAHITQDELDKTKKKTLSGLETQKNEPSAMVRNVSAVVNYGNNHPYGEVETEETIKNITVAHCENYYKTYFRPNVAYLAIVGDVSAAEIKPMIEKYFGKWNRIDVPIATYSIPALEGAGTATTVSFAPRTGAVQSVVSITYPIKLKPGTPDVIKARVANTVLGGGSQGRLFLDLREKHAWTYGAYSSLTDNELGGNFSATVQCRNAVSDSAIQALLDEMNLMRTSRVSDTSLQNSINYLSGSFAIGLEDPSRVAQFAINIERYHMPSDFYQNYLKNLQAVTARDVIEMSQKYITPDRANIVVAGSKDDVAPKLARFSAGGKINYYDYAGRPLLMASTKAAPKGVTADIVYKKFISAIGGAKAIGSIKTIKVVGTSTIQGTPITITEIKKTPGKWKQSIDVQMGDKPMTVQKQVINGKVAYQQAQGRKADLTGDDLEDAKHSADIAEELHSAKYGIKRTLKGVEKINGMDAYVLSVADGKGKKSTEYYDVASGLLVKKIQGTGERQQESVYADYREVPGTGGYKVPYKVSETQAGQTFTEEVTNVEVNKNIDDSEFK